MFALHNFQGLQVLLNLKIINNWNYFVKHKKFSPGFATSKNIKIAYYVDLYEPEYDI